MAVLRGQIGVSGAGSRRRGLGWEKYAVGDKILWDKNSENRIKKLQIPRAVPWRERRLAWVVRIIKNTKLSGPADRPL